MQYIKELVQVRNIQTEKDDKKDKKAGKAAFFLDKSEYFERETARIERTEEC